MYLTFPKKQVQELLDHSRKAAERSPTYEQLYDSRLRKDKKEFQPTDEKPFAKLEDLDTSLIPYGLHLVGDKGIYLMSNGSSDPQPAERVVYAMEADPSKVDDWWQVKRSTFGGDDGVEFLEGETVARWLAAAKGDTVQLALSPQQIEFLLG